MKKLILLIAAVVMVGCKKRSETSFVEGIPIVTIDSCEYISIMTYGAYYVYTHKGNCKYCAERRKHELENLVINSKYN